MCPTVSSEGPDCNAPATSLILIISGVKYSKNRSLNSLESVDPPKSVGTIRRPVLPKINFTKHGIRPGGGRRSNQNQLARAPQRPRADFLPIISRGVFRPV